MKQNIAKENKTIDEREDKVVNINLGSDYLWITTELGFCHKAWYTHFEFDGNIDNVNKTIKMLRDNVGKKGIIEDSEEICSGSPYGYMHVEDVENNVRGYLYKTLTYETDLNLADFIEQNKEEIVRQTSTQRRYEVGIPVDDNWCIKFATKQDIENFAHNTGARVSIKYK